MRKIGVLLDNLEVRSWQRKIIQHVIDHEDLKLEVLIINQNESVKGKSPFAYRLFQALDRKIFKVKEDAFLIKRLEKEVAVDHLYLGGIETRFSCKFEEKDLEKIKAYNLDVLIRFGFGILKGEILALPRYGVWSLHHGDNKINRGGPPGFWEVVNREEITGVTLQKLSADLDGGQVIAKSFTKTDSTSFSRNKNEVFWSGVELFNSSLDQLATGKIKISTSELTQNKRFYSYPLYRDPDNLLAFKIHSNFWIRRLKEVLDELINPPQWFLLYKYRINKQTETSIFRYKKLIPPKGYDWADPFVIEIQGEGFYLFFEELNFQNQKGHISYLEFNINGELKENFPVKVIEEEYHLSYPFIFKEDKTFYMIPESARSGELWLYESIEFPLKWEKKKRIFKNKNIYDASLLKYGEYYYLFGTEKIIEENSRDQYLFIYYSKNLFEDQWVKHPMSPVYRDVRRARPAGRIFESNGKLIRPSQIGAPKYGYGIQFNEIITLSPTEFSESKIDSILPNWENDLLATHTFNSVGGFSVLDAQAYIKR